MQGWRGEQPRTITRLIARAALIVVIGASLIVAVAQMIGTLIDVPTLVVRVRSGYAFTDPLRGVWFWNPMGMSTSYSPVLWSSDSVWMARLTPERLGSPNLTVREAWTGRVVCRIETDLDSLEFARFFDWQRDEGLLLYSPAAIYRADLNACTLDEILRVDYTINSASQAGSLLAFIAGVGDQRHVYLLNVTTGEVQQISQAPLDNSNDIPAYVTWPFREVAPDQWQYHSDYLLYSDRDEFHVYTTATGETQSVYDVDSRMFWGGNSTTILSEAGYNDQPRLVPISMYAFEDGRLSDQPIFHEPQVYYTRNAFNFSWSEMNGYFYVAADPGAEIRQPDLSTRAYRFDPLTRTITPLLPELDRVETFFYGRDGWLFVNQRGVPTTLAYHLPTGEQHMLSARITFFELWWTDDPDTILYITAANEVVRHDLRTGGEQPVGALPAGGVSWGNTAGGYLVFTVRESNPIQTCVYLLEMRGSDLRRMHCYAEGDSNVDFFWMEDN